MEFIDNDAQCSSNVWIIAHWAGELKAKDTRGNGRLNWNLMRNYDGSSIKRGMLVITWNYRSQFLRNNLVTVTTFKALLQHYLGDWIQSKSISVTNNAKTRKFLSIRVNGRFSYFIELKEWSKILLGIVFVKRERISPSNPNEYKDC